MTSWQRKKKKESTLIVLTGINAADSNHSVLSCCFSWGGDDSSFFGILSFSLSERSSKTSHLHPGRLAGRRSSGWIEKASDLTSVQQFSGLTPSMGEKFLSRSRSPGTFRRFWKRPHRNEALGICRNSPSLKDAKPASSPWELSELPAQGTEIQEWISIAAVAIHCSPGFQRSPLRKPWSLWSWMKGLGGSAALSEWEESERGTLAVRPLIRDAQPRWRGQARAEIEMLLEFWQVRTVEPKAPLCSGVSQIRAAEQEAEGDPAWLLLYHWACGSREDNCQGQGGPVQDPAVMWAS